MLRASADAVDGTLKSDLAGSKELLIYFFAKGFVALYAKPIEERPVPLELS
ncbi:MAG: hypothetical protein AB7L71_12005 [Vicinamibacterales bacterium]